MKNLKLFDVDFMIPEAYEMTSPKQVMLVESDGGTSQIDLVNGMEPTLKYSDSTVVFRGSGNEITLDESAKSVSQTARYENGSKELTFTVKRFTNPKQVCRGLKEEVLKHPNAIHDYSVDGYRADLGNGNYKLCTVQAKSLIIITTNDLTNLEEVFKKQTNKWAWVKIAFAAFLILFGVFAITQMGFDYRILFLWGIATYFLYGGYGNLQKKNNDCPKFKI